MKKWVILIIGLFILALLVSVYNRDQISVYTSSSTESRGDSTVWSAPILFVGDIMLGRYVETLSREEGDEMRSFGKITDFLQDHTVIANLEGPIPDVHTQTPNNGFSFSFSSSTPSILKQGGVTAVSLANNHMFDKGRRGWEETKRALNVGGIAHFGGYSPTEDDYFETKLGTTTVIVYGITMIATGWDEAQAIEVTKKLRAEHSDALLIAFLHWGDEYVTQNRYQREFAHALIKNGVDAIIGAHPHVVQGIEMYEGKPIFYSLGNFIFDQYWRDDLEDGLMVRLSRRDTAYTYELIPVRSERSIPRIANKEETERILGTVSGLSDDSLREQILQGVMNVR